MTTITISKDFISSKTADLDVLANKLTQEEKKVLQYTTAQIDDCERMMEHCKSIGDATTYLDFSSKKEEFVTHRDKLNIEFSKTKEDVLVDLSSASYEIRELTSALKSLAIASQNLILHTANPTDGMSKDFNKEYSRALLKAASFCKF